MTWTQENNTRIDNKKPAFVFILFFHQIHSSLKNPAVDMLNLKLSDSADADGESSPIKNSESCIL